jgi:hypothetical protein
MFLKSSRYYKTETITAYDVKGRSVQAVKLRRLPETGGEETVIDNRHKLDVMSKQQYSDGARFWHIADANTELEANALVETVGRIIKVPKS